MMSRCTSVHRVFFFLFRLVLKRNHRETTMNLPFKAYWDLLSQHIRPQKGRFLLLASLLLGSIGLRIFAPQIMRSFIDSALAGEALQTLTWTAIAFIGVALLQQI